MDATNLVRLPAGKSLCFKLLSQNADQVVIGSVAAVALAMMLVAIGFTLGTNVERGIVAVKQAEVAERDELEPDLKD